MTIVSDATTWSVTYNRHSDGCNIFMKQATETLMVGSYHYLQISDKARTKHASLFCTYAGKKSLLNIWQTGEMKKLEARCFKIASKFGKNVRKFFPP